MHTSVIPLVALLSGVLAQDINSLPECERNCVNSVLRIAPALGCPATNNGQPEASCLCGTALFAYAVRDCSSQSCPSGTDIRPVENYGLQYCQAAQASASGSTFSALSVFSSGAAGAGGAGGTGGASTSNTASETRSAITTAPIVATITSDMSTRESTVGSTTLYSGDNTTTVGGGGAGGGGTSGGSTTGGGAGGGAGGGSSSSGESGSATTTRPIVSTVTDASTTRETTVGSTTESGMPRSSSSAGAGATMAPLRLVGAPSFGGRQGVDGAAGLVLQAVGWTVGVAGLVQLMW